VEATEHHFTGKERDVETGLDYFGARYFSSAAGRWVSPDWSATVAPIPMRSSTLRRASIYMRMWGIIL